MLSRLRNLLSLYHLLDVGTLFTYLKVDMFAAGKLSVEKVSEICA